MAIGRNTARARSRLAVALIIVGGIGAAFACGSFGGAAAAGDAGSDDGPLGETPDGGLPSERLCGDTSAIQSNSTWPMPGRCATLVGLTSLQGPSTLRIKWRVPLPAAPLQRTASGPLIVAGAGPAGGDLVVVATSQSKIYAFARDGQQQWESQWGGSLLAGVGPDGTVWGYDQILPRLVRIAKNGTAPAVLDASVANAFRVVLTAGGGYLAGTVNGASGFGADHALLWSIDGGRLGPTGHDGLVSVQTGSVLSAIRSDGDARWQATSLGYDATCVGLVAPDGTRYSVTESQVYAVNPSGAVKGTASLAHNCFGREPGLAIGPDGTVYALGAEGTNILDDGDAGWVTSIDPNSMSKKWEFPMRGRPRGMLVDATGTLFVGSADHTLYAIAPDGRLRDSIDLGAPLVGSLVLGADGTMYALTGSVSSGGGSPDAGPAIYAIAP